MGLALVSVRMTEKAGARAVLHEAHPDHPPCGVFPGGGFAAIDTAGVIYRVALTPGVSSALARGMIEVVPDPVDPVVGEPDLEVRPKQEPAPGPARKQRR